MGTCSIDLLFKKFAGDFSEKYKSPPIRLSDGALDVLLKYPWPGNIRQLRNFVAQLSIIEKERHITENKVLSSLPKAETNQIIKFQDESKSEFSEREILYKVLFDMKKDLNELKKVTYDLIQKEDNSEILQSINSTIFKEEKEKENLVLDQEQITQTIDVEESLSLFEHEKKLIEKSLLKHKGKRKDAASELGISERTLYRKLKEFGL